MAWTASNPVSIGDPTKKSHYDSLWDNVDFRRDTSSGNWLNTGLKINDTGGDHGLTIKPNEDLSADKTLNIVTGDSDRTITLSGSPTLGDWFDQSVKQAASPIFGGMTANGNVIPGTDSSYALGGIARCWTNVYADAGVTGCSMRKYKTNIKVESLGLDFINALQPVSFEWKKSEGKTPDGVFRGLIAEEIQVALDEVEYQEAFAGVVREKDDNGDDWMGVRYGQMIPPLIKAVQELALRLAALETT